MTYKDVILDSYDVASPQVCRRQRRHKKLLVLPVVRLARANLASADGRQLSRLRLHHLAASDVLDGLKGFREIGTVVN